MSKRVAVEPFHPHELQFLTFGDAALGPRVLITAALHGGEATGVYAAEKLAAWLGSQSLRGAVTVLPVSNPAAFRRQTRTSPYDELDLNRIFPGKSVGTPSQVVAAAIWEEAKQVDYIVDLHCCGVFGSDYTLAVWQDLPGAKKLAEMLDIPVVIQSGGTPNQLFIEAGKAGIPAVIIELRGGQMGASGGIVNRESGERAFSAVRNLLFRLGVAAGEAPACAPAFYRKLQEVSSPGTGLWSPAVSGGDTVIEGQRLGDLGGEAILAPVTGVATSVRWDSYVFPGQTLANVAPR